MNEAHCLIASYHSKSVHIGGSSEINTITFFDELRLLRKQTYSHIINSLDKLLPKFAEYIKNIFCL